jgi:hypothetical protein
MEYRQQLEKFMQEVNPKLTGEEWARVLTKIRNHRFDKPENVKHEVLGEMDFDQVEKEKGWKYFKMPDPVEVVE